MILSVDTQSIWQNPTSISELKKKKENTRNRRELPQIMKICEKPTTNITHNDER